MVYGSDEDPDRLALTVSRHRTHRAALSGFKLEAGQERIDQCANEYERLLRSQSLLDFDAIVIESLSLVRQYDWARQCLLARFPVLVIDEYQDLGAPLHSIVCALAQAGARVFAVGDPDQSIYGFQGAVPALLEQLAGHLGVTPVKLRLNYRCGHKIVGASSRFIGCEGEVGAARPEAGEVFFVRCSEGLEQQADVTINTLVPDIQETLGCQLGDIAVVYLSKRDGNLISAQAQDAGVPYTRSDAGAPYGRNALTRWVESCAEWCSGGWADGRPRLSEIAHRLPSWYGVFDGRDLEKSQQHALVEYLLAHRDANLLLSDWLGGLALGMHDTLARVAGVNPHDSAELEKLIDASKSDGAYAHATIGSFARGSRDPDQLVLTTYHGAKGREFQAVVLFGMDEGRLPWSSDRGEALREKRRQFYVGLTRAVRQVHLTYSGFTVDRWGRRHADGPSRFLLELQGYLS